MRSAALYSRRHGLIVIGLFYLMQTAYAILACDNNVLGMWVATTIALMPAFRTIALGLRAATIAACIGQLPFVMWANYAECIVPYTGGGAPMAYVVVFLFGVPASAFMALTAGLVARWLAEKSRSNA